jgi:tripartite ATP-independent transporter DctM subunit
VNTPLAGVIAFGIMLVILALGMPIGLAMALVAFIGMAMVVNINAATGLLATTPFTFVGDYMMTSLPLFILMGAFAYRAGIITDAYNAAQKWLSRLPGGLSIATFAGCAGFGACTGSAAATVGFMTMATLPEMERYGYDPKLSTGTIAAGSTLGILIPPSIPLIVYGLFAQESIGRLFISGIIPGIALMLLFMATTVIWVIWKPEAGRPGPSATWQERWVSLRNVLGLIVLAALVSGGIWAGWFTPVEAGGIGSAGALIIGLVMRRMTWKAFTDALIDTAKLTGMVFVIVVGSQVLNQFLAITNLPVVAAQTVADSGLGAYAVLAIIVVFYIIGGCLMDSMGLMLLSMPILIPIVRALGVDMTMYGILMVIMIAMAGITPPVGMNVFILAATARHIPMYTIFKGSMPYFIAMFVLTILIIAFPEICTWLPNTMLQGP